MGITAELDATVDADTRRDRATHGPRGVLRVDDLNLGTELRPVEHPNGWALIVGGARRTRARPRRVARALAEVGVASLIVDIVTTGEARDPATVSDLPRLAHRVLTADWLLRSQLTGRGTPVALVGVGIGAPATLHAGAQLGNSIAALVALGGNSTDAGAIHAQVRAPHLVLSGDERRAALWLQAALCELSGQDVPARAGGRRRGLATTGVAVAAAFLAGALGSAEGSSAATLDAVGGALSYVSAAGQATSLTVSHDGLAYTLATNADPIVLGPGALGCALSADSLTATCPDTFGSLGLALGDLDDTVGVRSIGDPVTVQGEDGSDSFTVSSDAPGTAGDLLGILGPLTIMGGAGADSLTVSDQGDTRAGTNGAVVIGPASISGFAGPADDQTISYSGIASLDVEGADAVSESLTISDPSARTTVAGGGGDDTLILAAQTLPVTVQGGAGSDRVQIFSDSGVTLTNTLATSGSASFTLTGLSGEHALVEGGTGANALNAVAWTGNVTLSGGAGNDTLSSGSGADFLISGPGDDLIDGGGSVDTYAELADVSFILTDAVITGAGVDTISNVEQASLTGGAGANAFDVTDWTLPATLVGGASDDLLQWERDSSATLGGATFTAAGAASVSLVSIERASLAGGAGANELDAAGYGGSATLLGGGGSDTLGSGLGSDVIDGGLGLDQVVASADSNMTLTPFALSGAGIGSDTLTSIEAGVLTGGPGANTLVATSFSAGSVTIDGGDGDDTLVGSAAADDLDGGPGTDVVTGAGGSDTLAGGAGGADVLSETADANVVLSNTSLVIIPSIDPATTDTLSGFERAILTGGASANSIRASSFSLGPATLAGGEGNDTLQGTGTSDLLDGGGGIDQADAVGTMPAAVTLTDSSFTGLGTDTLAGLELVNLSGGATSTTFNLSGWTGGGSLAGGGGSDVLVFARDSNVVLSDALLNPASGGQVALSSVEASNLTGGPGANSLIAADFSGPVTIAGGEGDDTVQGGSGSDVLAGGGGSADRVIGSGDGVVTVTDTQLIGSGTDSLSSFEQAALLGGSGADQLTATGFGGTTSLTGGPGADTLTAGPGPATLVETVTSDYALVSDAAQNGTLTSGLTTDVLVGIDAAIISDGLTNTDADMSGWVLPATLDAGPGVDRLIANRGTSITLTDTSLTGSGAAPIVLAGFDTAILGGGSANDVLDVSGFSGPTTLAGGLGNDTIVGGPARDLITAKRDATFALSDTTLTVASETDSLSGVDAASLTGGSGANNFTVAGWSGSATVEGLSGLDSVTVVGTAAPETANITNAAVTIGTTSVSTANIEFRTLDAGDGSDYVEIAGDAVSVFGGLGEDSLSATAAGPLGVRLDGGENEDSYSVAFGALAGPVDLNDTGLTGADILFVPDCTGVSFTPTAVTKDGETVTLTGVERSKCGILPPPPPPPDPEPPPEDPVPAPSPAAPKRLVKIREVAVTPNGRVLSVTLKCVRRAQSACRGRLIIDARVPARFVGTTDLAVADGAGQATEVPTRAVAANRVKIRVGARRFKNLRAGTMRTFKVRLRKQSRTPFSKLSGPRKQKVQLIVKSRDAAGTKRTTKTQRKLAIPGARASSDQTE